MAELVDAEFSDEATGTVTEKISGSYIEFAERRALPEFQSLPPGDLQRHHRRDGFETANADSIFESTNQRT